MKGLLKVVPWFFLALFTVELVVVFQPRKNGELHTREFGRLPVLLNGRIQPFDSVARNSLLQMRSTGDVPLELVPSWKFWHHPEKLRSTEWLLEVLFKPELADTRPIFLIHHPEILSELKLEEKGIEKSGLRYYTFAEVQPSLREIEAQATKAAKLEDAQRGTYDKQILKLANAVFLYQKLKNSIEPEGAASLGALVDEFQSALPAGVAAFRARQSGETPDREALERFARVVRPFDAIANLAEPLVLPPLNPETNRTGWVNLGVGMLDTLQTGNQIHPAVPFFSRMADSYGQGDAAAFNAAVAGYREWLTPKFGKEVSKARAEYYYNQVKAFLHAIIIYIVAFLLAGGALLTFGSLPALSESLRRSAFYLIGLAFVVHTFGIIFRMVLEGRPPVTNLYSSAIFIGWAACLLGLILERIYRIGLGAAVAALTGFITLLIAHNLALDGDTMKMLVAVLDTNFWLATHVVTITIGYSATFVAGALALAYIVLGIFTPLLTTSVKKTAAGDTNLGKALSRMVYAIICFATFFSFVGTVLGGIWADQSWGRFWGWDPKENGALLIVLWNAIVLHARWGGLLRDRGIMNLAIFGNVVTSFSWFGVNMLGIGLHSYGFMDEAFKWLVLFTASQVAIMILAGLPLHMWKSFQNRQPPPGTGDPHGSNRTAAAVG
ncbi:MAG TPA: cytochrome c biogenesis protein CcsA [Verrucomicrobiae bacterium]|nr:cytochrome c biogenesis protein CcsA [Verrucomicrobiae bacterium]